MDLTGIFTNRQPADKMNWGEAPGLWSIGRFKVIGITMSRYFWPGQKIRKWKNSLNMGIEMPVILHIKKIVLMHKEGLGVPSVTSPKNIHIVGKQAEPNTCISEI